MADDKWTVALMGFTQEGYQLGDIVAFKLKGEDWTETEQKDFLIVDFEGFTKEEMFEFIKPHINLSDGVVLSNKKYQVDNYLLKVNNVDFKQLGDRTLINPQNGKIKIKDKTKEIKDKSKDI